MRAVTQYTKDGQLVKKYDTIKQASEETGIIRTSINHNLNNRSKSAGGYVFKYTTPKVKNIKHAN